MNPANSILIYTPTVTSRLKYTLDLLIADLTGIDYELSTDPDQFGFYTGPKFNYSQQQFGDELFFYSTGILFEKKIRRQDITVFDWNDTKVFFATHPKYILPFDPFAATFYLVSRYEEYLPYSIDKHDRYDASESLAFQKGFLQKPVVNIFAKKLKQILQQNFPDLVFRERTYKFISTVDIDNAWAFKEKGLMRTTGAIVRNLVKLDFSALIERILVLLEKKKDPYDTYDHFFNIQKKYGFETIYFFLLGDYGENDKNISSNRKNFQSLIKGIADYCEIGIHPSYASSFNPAKIRIEQLRLSKIVHREILKSRQHFLKLSLPETYRYLIGCDITDDYTMGFAGEVGFRAGICTPFYFYDLQLEAATKLRIHPFAVMDATLRLYMKIKPEEVMSYVGPMIKEVKNVNGIFMTLWHNESLSEMKPWENWHGVYEDIIKAAV